MALLGRAEGVFELWMWPLKLVHGLRLAFDLGGAAPIPGPAVVAASETSPDRASLSYAHPEFTLVQTFLVAPDERALAMLLDVRCEREISVLVLFECDFRPMWPAGIGGQIAARDEATGAL